MTRIKFKGKPCAIMRIAILLQPQQHIARGGHQHRGVDEHKEQKDAVGLDIGIERSNDYEVADRMIKISANVTRLSCWKLGARSAVYSDAMSRPVPGEMLRSEGRNTPMTMRRR